MNEADSERIASLLDDRGMKQAKSIKDANYIVINSCMVRASAEHRVYGLIRNLSKQREKTGIPQKIVLAGCMVGAALSDKRGKLMRQLREKLPDVDEFLPMSEVGFDYLPNRSDRKIAWVPISNGCNNFCSFCVVPFTRGREVSRPFEDIMNECRNLRKKGYQEILLIGQNVNSFGSDLIQRSKISTKGGPASGWKFQKRKPVIVKHLGRYRIPTLFPHLLEEIAKLGFEKVDFISSNPWDFSDELIDVIARYPNITRYLHLAVQSGDDEVLRKMNRWYTAQEYISLIKKIRKRVPDITIGTDIIVGFPGETEEAFHNSVALCKKVGFVKAYVSRYSQRPMTQSAKVYEDDVPEEVKKKRWLVLEKMINSYL